jgi:hypothetical protein
MSVVGSRTILPDPDPDPVRSDKDNKFRIRINNIGLIYVLGRVEVLKMCSTGASLLP